MTNQWNVNKIPDLTGKIVLITGANSGIGFETGKILANKNAQVIAACRNFDKKLLDIPASNQKNFHFISPLDLSDLDSIGTFTKRFKQEFNKLHILINNAGVMGLPFMVTKQGYELHYGVNHLGHFALTALLSGSLLKEPGSRVVTVSSLTANTAELDIPFKMSIPYNKFKAYSGSKLANLVFFHELSSRLKSSANTSCISVAAHPGYVRTRLQRHTRGFLKRLHNIYTQYRFAQDAYTGSLPVIRAATDTTLNGGEYLGPGGPGEMYGAPVIVSVPARATDPELGKNLWKISEKMSGINFNLPVI